MPRKKFKETPVVPAPVVEREPLSSRHFVEHPVRGTLKYRNFDEFWFMVRRERGLDDSVKQHLWLYFRSSGILGDPTRYEEGFRNFGF